MGYVLPNLPQTQGKVQYCPRQTITMTLKRPQRAPGSLPLLGHVRMMNLQKLSMNLCNLHRDQSSQVLMLNIFGQTIYHLRHPADIADAMSIKVADFVKPPGIRRLHRWLGNGLPAQMDTEAHSQQRALLNPAFRSTFVGALLPVFAKCSLDLADVMQLHCQQNEAVEVQDLCRRAALDIIGLTGFNYDFQALNNYCHSKAASKDLAKPAADALASFNGLSEAAMKLAYDLPLPDFLIPGYRQYCRSIKELDSIVKSIIDQRRENGVEDSAIDLLAFMMRSQQEGMQGDANFPSDKLMRDELMTTMFAGSDTTSHTLAFLLHALANQPAAQDRVAAEVESVIKGKAINCLDGADLAALAKLPFVAACVKETLRLYNTAVGAPRLAARDTQLGEHFVPVGTICISDIYCLHRNEAFWPLADEWRPERFLSESNGLGPTDPRAYMPFLVGPRSCIGRNFALLELQIAACIIVGRFRLKGVQSDLDITQDLTLRSRSGIWLHVSPR